MSDDFAFPALIVVFVFSFLIMLYGASNGDDFLVGVGFGGMAVTGGSVAAWFM